MADYFTYFSVVLPLTKEQQDHAMELARKAEQHRGEDTPADLPEGLLTEDWTFETEMTPDGLWLHSEYGGQESACSFIQHLLQKFNFAPHIGWEWSHDCTRPKTDAYGGGAAFVTAKKIKTFSTSAWLAKMAR